jgi:iron complex outermembrane receptor protein
MFATARPSDVQAASSEAASLEALQSMDIEQLGNVLVTAQRREERLRDVPSAVYLVTGDLLADQGQIVSTQTLVSQVPGARFNDLQNPLLSEISIRGSGTGRATDADPAVGLFANGVYVGGGSLLGRNISPIDSFDLARLEVLEGPQGALYGRNAEYGVLNLISQIPKQSDEAYVDDIYNFHIKGNRFTGILNHAVNDTTAIRIGLQDIQQAGGFVYNPTLKDYFDITQGWMGRAQVRFTPGPWDITLLGQIQRLQLPSYAQVSYILPGTIGTFPLGYFGNRNSIPVDANQFTGEDVGNVVLMANYDFGGMKLSSTSSYRKRTSYTRRGFQNVSIDLKTEAMVQALGEQGSYPFAYVTQRFDTTMIYEDVHLAGHASDDRFKWLVGGEYLHLSSDGIFDRRTDPCATAASPNPKVGAGICGGTPTQPTCTLLTPGAAPCPAIFPGAFGSDAVSGYRFSSWAAYGSLSYKVAPRLTLTGDIRVTTDDKHLKQNTYQLFTALPFPYVVGGTIPPLDLSYSKSKVTYTGTASYQLPGRFDGLVYARVGTGYRAGDFNTRSSPQLINGLLGGKPPPAGYAPVTPTYGDETLTSYELGYKGDVIKDMFVTVAAYVSDMDNAIVAVPDGCALNNSCAAAPSNYVVNAGSVRARGVEISLNTRREVAGGILDLLLTGTNQYAKYYDVPATRPGLATTQSTGLPLAGTAVPQTPHWMTSANINYRHAIIGDWEGFMNLAFHGQWGGIQDPAVATLPGIKLANYQHVDLRLGADYKNTEVALIWENVTDETHVQQIAAQASNRADLPYLPTSYRYSNPGTVALEVKHRW